MATTQSVKLEKARKFWRDQLASVQLDTRIFGEQETEVNTFEFFEFKLDEGDNLRLLELTKGNRVASFAFCSQVFQEVILNLSSNDNISLIYPQLKKGKEMLFFNYSRSESIKLGLVNISDQIKKAVANQFYPYFDLIENTDKITFKKRLSRYAIVDKELIDPELNLDEWRDTKLTLICDGPKFQLRFCKGTYTENNIKYIASVFTNIIVGALENVNEGFAEIWNKLAQKDEFKASSSCESSSVETSTIQGLLENSLDKNSERIALKYGSDELSYGDVKQKIEALSVAIRQDSNYDMHSVLAIQNSNPLNAVLGVLATIKCGNPFTIISAEEPIQRVEQIMNLSRANQLIKGDEIPNNEIKVEPCQSVEESNCAYVVFTSGTSGKPKGIKVSNKNITNTLDWHIRHYNYGPETVAVNTLALQFDAAIEAVFSVLFSGGKLILFSEEEKKDLKLVGESLSDNQVNYWVVNTSYFASIVKYVQPENQLKKVILGGEYVNKRLREEFKKKLPDTELHIEYGLTETSITTHSGRYDENSNLNLVGSPIQNTKICIVNAELEPVVFGQKGQIIVAGDGVALEYIGTDLSLRNYPFNSEEAYVFTGDRGLMHTDGSLEFFGRADSQIKIRGHRIEPLGIEQVVENYDSIEKATILVSNRTENLTDLVCFFIAKTIIVQNELDAFLMNHLPEYMIPDACIQVSEYPLTFNGKVDNKELLNIYNSKKDNLVELTTETESKLAKVWSDLLNIELAQIGANTDFFRIGGHSLLATELILDIQKKFNVNLEIKHVFGSSVLSEMAKSIDLSDNSNVVQIEKTESKELYVASSSQKRLYFLNKLDQLSTSYNMPMFFPLGMNVDQSKLEKTLNQVANRHQSLRTKFVEKDNTIYQNISENLQLDIEVVTVASSDVESVISQLIRPFDLNNDLLIRVAVIEVIDSEKFLFIDLHHIIADGRSCSILMEDFWNLYSSETELAEKSLEYIDYSEWQQQFAKSDVYKKQEEFWLERLEVITDKVDLPSDKSRPDVFHFGGEEIFEVITGEALEMLKAIANETGATLHMVFIALMNVLMYKYSGNTDITLGTTIEGRNHSGLDRIVGMFVNSLAIKTQFDEDSTFMNLLEKVKNNCINAYGNQDVQFESLIEKLSLERDPSRNPLFDVCVVSQNFRKPTDIITEELNQEFGSEQSETIELVNENCTAKFDLTLFLEEVSTGVYLKMEYYTGILNQVGAKRIMSQLLEIINSLGKNIDTPLNEINVIGEQERAIICDTQVSTTTDFKQDSVVSIFQEQVLQTPNKIAVEFGEGNELTYEELDQRSNQIANYLTTTAKLEAQSVVGILVSKNYLSIPVMLGALKAGMIYLPLDPMAPMSRLKTIVDNADCDLLFTDKMSIGTANTLQWKCPNIRRIMVLDSTQFFDEIENLESEKLLKELWNHVAANAKDEIDLGGWTSSFTGLNFSKAEMDEYADNAVNKIRAILPENARVLEIGCASGLTMYPLLNEVGYYHGTDISEKTITWNTNKAKEEGISNVAFQCLSAWEIDQVTEKDFDVIVINSVVQSFSGYNYFRAVIKKCMDLLKSQGKIFLGDIMDLDRKELLIDDLKKFKQLHSDKEYDTRTNYTNELFLNKRFLEDFQAGVVEIDNVECSDKVFTINNELTDYRFDATLFIDKSRVEPVGVKEAFQDDLKLLDSLEVGFDQNKDLSDQVAYMIYTSGTSGVPKGVKIQNKALVNYCLCAKEKYIGDLDRGNFPLYSSITFDLTVTSIYLPLISGNTIVCYDGNYKELLIKQIFEDNKVDAVKLTPSHLRLLNTFKLNTNTSIKRLILGGEQLTADVVRDTWKTFGRKVIIENEYGPTEATVGCMNYTCTELSNSNNVPIGLPLANTEVFVLDENGKEVPVGVKGELYIGGNSLAQGYHKGVEINKNAFVSSQLSANNRLYRTGDEVKILSNGIIEYIGRIDNQVKVRGYRVEKDEIKVRLEEQFEVDEALVVHDTDDQGQLFLSAYLKVSEELDTIIIRERLKEYFPDYMLPDYIIQLEQFPLTTNGKIDVKSLPNPREFDDGDYEVASTPSEVIITEVWRDVLDLNVININESFFKLGGNSLKLVMVYNSLKEKLDAKIVIANLFEYPTVKQLAQFLDSEKEEKDQGLSEEDLDESTDQLSQMANLFEL